MGTFGSHQKCPLAGKVPIMVGGLVSLAMKNIYGTTRKIVHLNFWIQSLAHTTRPSCGPRPTFEFHKIFLITINRSFIFKRCPLIRSKKSR